MEKVGNYGVYQRSYYDNAAQTRNNAAGKAEAEKTEGAKAPGEQVQLSENAKNLLKEMQQKYGNMDFIIANYSTDEEASALLARGTKEYSVLIDPETLEKMAADEEVKNKYFGIIDDATSKLGDLKSQLSEDEQADVKSLGISISDDGTVSYFAELEKASAKQRERIEANREEKKEEAAKAEKENAKKAEEKKAEEKRKEDRVQRTRVQSDSIEDLLQKIRGVDWSTIKAENVVPTGGRFDYSV